MAEEISEVVVYTDPKRIEFVREGDASCGITGEISAARRLRQVVFREPLQQGALGRIADDDWLATKFWSVEQFDRNEKRVHVHVENGGR